MFNSSSVSKQKAINANLKVIPDTGEPERQPKPGIYLLLFLLVVIGAFGTYRLLSGNEKSPIVIHPDGSASLAPHRDEKLNKELDDIDNAEQYVLLATADGYFPCYACPNGAITIFLYAGEVWRYGMTRQGELGRYPTGNYGAENLIYLVQFTGTTSACEKQEKIQIYKYPLLPEARARGFTLPRPPGNQRDR